MVIKEMRWNGLLIWPPHWTEESPKVMEYGLLKNVEILPLTDLIKIDAAYAGTILSGLIFSREEPRLPVSQTKKKYWEAFRRGGQYGSIFLRSIGARFLYSL